ncbi:hypothetical protein HZH66_000734 [Vespula vulgaris]|uniref:Ribosomal biogenesis protein LAS1L n=2 Tax=Vespula vulgaris TaxID=7454 RepID=A0A834KRW7_VESVU|nr:ribosomal biogenesis protein LAS1L isoform X1 [Vespula vulgaris]KAF7411838.1 hypothetical protein HZH66_000734 [Vespula vulgaris]
MALFGKREDLKLVPWFSPAEWHQVYKQIYSNNNDKQVEAYETLLAWKARMSKLPVGVDCTLSIIQVCLRDREWTPKIDNAELPIHYENDLCLMYSTAIMRFLNHISNIGHTKQTSLFQIAKQLNIPEWIVNLRHDAAHGHELPSIDVLRIAVNLLLTWLHEEYWIAEAKALEKYYAKKVEIMEINESEDTEAFTDLIELWVAIGLYIRAGYDLVDSIPDTQLQKTLYDLRMYAVKLTQQIENNEEESEHIVELKNVRIKKKYSLSAARAILLAEISRYLGKNNQIVNKENIVLNALLESEAFLLTADILTIFSEKDDIETNVEDQLPISIIQFWQDIIILLQDVNMLEALILKLLTLVKNEQEPEYKRHMAALWINTIAQGFAKLSIAQQMFCTLEHKLRKTKNPISQKALSLKVEEEINKKYLNLRNVLFLNISNTIPRFLTDIHFLTDIILNANMFTCKFISPLLQLVIPKLDVDQKEHLLKLIQIYTQNEFNKFDGLSNKINEEIFTIEDIIKLNSEHNDELNKKEEQLRKVTLADQNIRNNQWKLTHVQYSWTECPIGILPWQIDSLQYLKPIKVIATNSNELIPTLVSDIIPGIVDKTNLRMQSQIIWDNVLRKKRRLKRKQQKGEIDIMYKAIEMVKKQK